MDWHSKNISEIKKNFSTNFDNGLFSDEAKNRLSKNGKNQLQTKKQRGIIYKFLEQFSDFLIIILLIAAGISIITSICEHNNDYADSIIILMIVILNAAMGVIQNTKAEKAIEALKKLSSPHCRVLRDGATVILPSEEIVTGDILIFKAGDLIPCDARLISSNSLKCDESALTGESVASEKDYAFTVGSKASVAERHNMVFSGCVITNGYCKAVCVATGMATQVGEVAKMLSESDSPETPLKKRLNKTGKVLGIAILFICAGIFILGVLKNQPIMPMFMISISLAVAAIPEGLPAIVTTLLSMGVSGMVKNNVIIRKLPAVETLGCATVICSDKTGTLTQNKMTVTDIRLFNNNNDLNSIEGRQLLSFGSLCSNACFNESGELTGEPTEKAILEAAKKSGVNLKKLNEGYERIGEIPFSSERKLMTTIHNYKNNSKIIITKGAPDYLLSICSFYLYGDDILPITKAVREEIQQKNNDLAKNALRVIGVAYKTLQRLPDRLTSENIECSLVFCGLIGMIDPPRPEAVKSVAICKKAGIRPLMITGDHLVTAKAIAEKMGILGKGKAITGRELSEMSEDELRRHIYEYTVFARVTPAHKALIVKAFQSHGEVVAMTGDGVNDAPALKLSDIGCAMGKCGTEVAKGAADMILTDDNFASIVVAIKEGRGIYENIKRAIRFLLSCNVGEIITVTVAFLFSFPIPLYPIQLLFVNLVTDGLPALALGAEKPDSDIMERKPIRPNKSLFAGGLGYTIVAEGFMIGALALLAFVIGNIYYSEIVARTMCFCVLSLSQLAHTLNMRSKRSLFKTGFFQNKYLFGAITICASMQIFVVSFSPLTSLFKVTSLTDIQWLTVAILSIMPVIIKEIEKFFFGKEK